MFSFLETSSYIITYINGFIIYTILVFLRMGFHPDSFCKDLRDPYTLDIHCVSFGKKSFDYFFNLKSNTNSI